MIDVSLYNTLISYAVVSLPHQSNDGWVSLIGQGVFLISKRNIWRKSILEIN